MALGLLSETFIWWRRQTLGTRLLTWARGQRVGTDAFGNAYYRERGGERRWVIYRAVAEASAVPPGWHAWLHRTTDEIPGPDEAPAHDWEQPHRPNQTGTAAAYRPVGSTLGSGRRPPATGDYEAWAPAGN
jgi:NADH:ubiquinone oxidoreductase subunit